MSIVTGQVLERHGPGPVRVILCPFCGETGHRNGAQYEYVCIRGHRWGTTLSPRGPVERKATLEGPHGHGHGPGCTCKACYKDDIWGR